MTKSDAQKHIEVLANKASASEKSDDALKFSQAASNLGNALCALNSSDNK